MPVDVVEDLQKSDMCFVKVRGLGGEVVVVVVEEEEEEEKEK